MISASPSCIRWNVSTTQDGTPRQSSVRAHTWFYARQKGAALLLAEPGNVDVKPLDTIPFASIHSKKV